MDMTGCSFIGGSQFNGRGKGIWLKDQVNVGIATSTFSGLQTTQPGAAINIQSTYYNSNQLIMINNCQLNDNNASYANGGALAIEGVGYAFIIANQFNRN